MTPNEKIALLAGRNLWETRSGRYWDRTSDLCRVKVSETLLVRRHNQGDHREVPGQRPFWRLIVSRQLSVHFTVLWTWCGREPEPAEPSTVHPPRIAQITETVPIRALCATRPHRRAHRVRRCRC